MTNYQFTNQDGVLTIFIEGPVYSNNANDVENNIFQIVQDNEFNQLILDVLKMDYISSAGLRIVLKLMHQYKNFKVINAKTEVYDIFDMTGFTRMLAVEKAYKVFDVSNCPIVGEGAKGIVYRYSPDTIVKVYKNNDALPLIKKERELAKKAFIMGVPTAISYDVVKVGNSYGSVFELLDCDCLSDYIKKNPENLERYAQEFATLLKTIHKTEVIDKTDMHNQVEVINTWLKNCRGILDDKEVDKLQEIVNGIESKDTLIHGDYHTNNLMVQQDEILLIDMDTLAYGNPIFELAVIDFAYNTMNNFDIDSSAHFLGIDKETSQKFYKLFLKYYFEGQDNLDRTLKIIDLLSLARVVSHVWKRDKNSPYLKDAKEKIENLLKEVD